MQFDQACKPGDKFLTGYEFIESKYKKYGLAMPHIIFWNLRGNTNGYVNKTNQEGTTMLSGFGASTFQLVYLSFQKSHSFSAQHAHNMPLQLAFEYGIPVSILLTSFISYLCFRAYCEVFKKGNKISLLNKCWFASSSVAVSSHILDITYYDGKISILIWILLSGLKCIIGNKSYKEIL